jgi:hypothetical protein
VRWRSAGNGGRFGASLRSRGNAIIFLELLFNACLGLGFAVCARDRLRTDGPFAMPAFMLVLTFVGLVLVPATLYVYLVHTAWSWSYLVDPAKVPPLAVVPVLVTVTGGLILGWYLGGWLIRSDRKRPLMYVGAGLGVALLAGMALLWARMTQYGTYEAWESGAVRGLMDVKLGYVLVVLVLAVTAAAGYVALELVRDSRRVRAR